MPRLQQPQGQQPMMQGQVRNQQFMNQNPQIAMQQQQQQQQPMMGQHDQMNMKNWSPVPGAGPNQMNMNSQQAPQQQQLRQGINSSPLMPQQPTPMQQQQQLPPQPQPPQPSQQHQQMPGPPQMPMQPQPQPPIAKPTTAAAQKTAAKTTAKKGTQGRKKSKANNSAPTPAALPAATPGTLANAIKTPHSIPTPQIPPQSHSNKNTPSAHSPAYPVKATPSGATPGTGSFSNVNSNNVYPTPEIDVFAMSSNDSKVAKRRELLNTDPEKFFCASLANLLDLDESVVDNVKVSPRMSNGKPIANSPLSPKISGEWTSEVKPMAITTSFRQVDAIKDLTNDDIISSCGMLAIQEVEEPKQLKREREQEDELDTLFNDKKLKLTDGNNFDKFLYEPSSFDEWKDFVVSFIQ